MAPSEVAPGGGEPEDGDAAAAIVDQPDAGAPSAAEAPSDALPADPAILDSPADVATDGDQADPAPRVAPRIPILIEIDPRVTGGSLLDRFDVMVRARIVSAGTIERAALHADGAVRSATIFGPQPSDMQEALETGVVVEQRLALFNLTRRREDAALPCPCRIVARDVNGHEYEQEFVLTIDPFGNPPVRVTEGPLQSEDSFDRGRVPTILYVERVNLDDDGLLVVDGWGISVNPVVAVQVHVDGFRVSARMGIEREDVAAAYPAYPHAQSCGYRVEATLPEALRGVAELRVEMLCRQGLTHEVTVPIHHGSIAAPEPEPEPAPEPAPAPAVPSAAGMLAALGQGTSYSITAGFQFPSEALLSVLAPPRAEERRPEPETDRSVRMFVDEVVLEGDGILSVSGWATSAVGIARVAILLDDGQAGVAELGHDRPDVGTLHPDIPAARFSGFRFSRRVAERIEGEHLVSVVVTTLMGDEWVDTQTVVATPASAPIMREPEPEPEPPPAPPPPTVEADPNEMKFNLDSPGVTDGRVVETITGRLTIDGWVLSRSAITGMEVWMDAQRLGDAHHGLARQDVGAAFPDWPNSVRSGFAFHCPPRSLRDGVHTIRLVIRCESGYVYEHAFQVEIRRAESGGETLGIRRRLPRIGREFLLNLLDRLSCRPEFTIILRQDGPVDAERLQTTFYSLMAQAYPQWRMLLLCDSTAGADAARPLIDGVGTDIAWRCSVLTPADSGWTRALGRDAEGLYLILCPGDELGVDALAELALGRGLNAGADFIYADEARISPVSKEREAFFKPDFSPDLLLSTNYIGRPWAATGALLAQTELTPAALADRGEYDVVLRCTELAARIHHVPKLLCQRGVEDPDGDLKAEAALLRAAARRGIAAEVLPTPVDGAWRFKRLTPVRGKVSIIIPTCAARGLIETCLTTLREVTDYRNFEIIVIDNIPEEEIAWKLFVAQHADKVVDLPDAFNWSRFNNRAADVADGEFILFLNDDIEIEQSDWLDVLLENAARPEVGIVGPRLLYPSRTIQHAGMFLAGNGIARHAFRFAAEDDPCYFGLAMTQRNVMAVTGACMLMRREVFEAVGRFDEAHQIVNNDLDFCLRVHRAGLLTVYTPHATLVHHELASRDRLKDVYDASHFNSMWADLFAAGDPYFNPRLYRHADDHRPDDEPVETVFSGQPLFTPEEIRRLLVVKLDHIGDFITALPSIRRLKELFPLARITVLSGPAAQSFAAFEPAIDQFIPFEFFHVRSGLGRKEVTDDDLQALGNRLAAYRFDLAIDLRKQPDTRDILKYAKARYLAGYDHQAQFNFLDVALEWETDRSLHHKRNHVSDDLLNLVEAVGQASRSHQPRLAVPEEARAEALARLPDDVRALFGQKVAIIHPGVGSAVKQWPLPYFSALIDLLISRNGLNVVLIGSPDEAELAETVLEGVSRKSAVASLVGRTPLRELPALLANAALYVGNDSGPKHIAAAVGVPSIGIHSGVVDTMEWGPVGAAAIALRRNMACSPCYLARQEDCPRALACLKGLEPALVHEAAVAMLATPLPQVAPQPLTYTDWRAARATAGVVEHEIPSPPAADTPDSQPADDAPGIGTPQTPLVAGKATEAVMVVEATPRSRRRARREGQSAQGADPAAGTGVAAPAPDDAPVAAATGVDPPADTVASPADPAPPAAQGTGTETPEPPRPAEPRPKPPRVPASSDTPDAEGDDPATSTAEPALPRQELDKMAPPPRRTRRRKAAGADA